MKDPIHVDGFADSSMITRTAFRLASIICWAEGSRRAAGDTFLSPSSMDGKGCEKYDGTKGSRCDCVNAASMAGDARVVPFRLTWVILGVTVSFPNNKGVFSSPSIEDVDRVCVEARGLRGGSNKV